MRTGENDYEYRGEPPYELVAVSDPPATAPVRRDARARTRRRRAPAWCGVLLLVPVSVPLAARAADVDGPSPIPQLLAFLPWYLVPGWLALVCGVLARRVVVMAWAVVALTATGWFLQPYGTVAPPERQGPADVRFRVLTANLHFGDATGPLLDVLREEHPQLVSVQECDSRCAAALRTPAMRQRYPHRVIVTGGAAEGSALLSTFPLRTEPSLPCALGMPGAVVDAGGARRRVRAVHPLPPEFRSIGPWRRELGLLRDAAATDRGLPLVLAGDFNSSQDHAAFRAVLDTGLRDVARLEGQSRTPTWPSLTAPPLGAQIDHVLVSRHFETAGARFLDLPGTDHRALLVDLRLFASG